MQADTNRVGLYYSPETNWGENPPTSPKPTMTQMRITGETLGHTPTLTPSTEIRPDRNQPSNALTYVKAEGQINFELSYASFDDMLANAMCDSWTTISQTGLALTVAASAKTVTRGTGSFITDGVKAGMFVKFKNFDTAANNSYFRVASLTATVLTLEDPDAVLVDDTDSSADYHVHCLRNGVAKTSFNIEKRFTDITEFIDFVGMAINQFNLTATAGQLVKGDFSFMGKQATAAGTSVSLAPDTAANVNDIMSASTNAGKVIVDGVVLATAIKEIGLSVSNNLRDRQQVGALASAGLGYGTFDVKGTAQAYFEDLSLYTKMLNHTPARLSWRFADQAGNVIIITAPKVYFAKADPAGTAQNADVMQNLDWSAVLDTVSNCQLQIDSLAA